MIELTKQLLITILGALQETDRGGTFSVSWTCTRRDGLRLLVHSTDGTLLYAFHAPSRMLSELLSSLRSAPTAKGKRST